MSPSDESPDALESRARREIARVARVPIERAVDAASLAHDLGVDSLGHIEIVMRLETLCAVTVPDAEAARFVTVADVLAALRRHTGPS